jgi:hypothetical protein
MRDTQPNFVANSARSVKLATELVSTADVRNPSSRHGAQYTCLKGKGKGTLHPRTGQEGPEGE